MKTIVTHRSPDLDAISSVWLIKRFLPGWQDAQIKFVPAGEKFPGMYEDEGQPIEKLNGEKIIHVDTGLGALDHHQTQDNNTCGASLTMAFVKSIPENGITQNETRKEAVNRIIEFTIDDDHFQEVFFENPSDDVYDMTTVGIIDGLKSEFVNDDSKVTEIAMTCLDALLHTFENKIFAENELKEKGIKFETRFGKAMGIETYNDTVLKLAQKMGYVIVVRKDPGNGSIRVKTLPKPREKFLHDERLTNNESRIYPDVDLTSLYEAVKKMDPDASWYFHVSKKMLLNGSSKNPTMRGSKITLQEMIDIIKSI